MTTVYMVEEGKYSDYSVTGLFSTKEKAEAFIRNNPIDRYDGYHDVRECILDELEDSRIRTVWFCTIDLTTGEITGDYTCKESCRERYTEVSPDCGGLYAWARSSVSLDHCQKLVIETKQRMLRERSIRS